jgi:hypothetical protein
LAPGRGERVVLREQFEMLDHRTNSDPGGDGHGGYEKAKDQRGAKRSGGGRAAAPSRDSLWRSASRCDRRDYRE